MAFKIDIKSDERVFIAGKTGSGKTYLTTKLLDNFPFVIVLDNKGFFGMNKATKQFELSAQGYGLCRELDKLPEYARQYNKIVYRPLPEIEANPKMFLEEMNAFFEWVYNRENCVLDVDECAAVCDSHNVLPYHNKIMKMGREKNIGCINCSQQPVNVHNTLISEAEHYFIFETRLQAHRDKLAGFIGDEVRNKRLEKRWFWYFNADVMDNPILMKPI